MTVRELCEALYEVDPELIVVFRNEGIGFTTVTNIEVSKDNKGFVELY